MSILKFDEKDLITWANRHDVKVGAKGYFGHSIAYLNANIKANHVYELINISDDFTDCFSCSISGDIRSYDFFLPIEAVKEEKKFRPLKTIEEMYELIFDIARNSEIFGIGDKSEEQCIYELVSDCILHLKSKQSGAEYYTAIRSICKNEDIQILINSSFTFEELFDEFEIKINGKWQPFGIPEE